MPEICNLLKEKRLEKTLEISDIKMALLIKEEYVYALEEGDYSIFPTKAFYYGYLKQYAKFLEIEEIQLNIAEPVIAEINMSAVGYRNKRSRLLWGIIFLLFSFSFYYGFFEEKSVSDLISVEIENHSNHFVELE